MDYETRVAQADAGLDSVYKPQVDLYNSQIGGLQGVYDQQRSRTDQARVNAFRGIEQTANSRGMFFSGQPIQKQLEYNFGTFDPTMANIDSEQRNKKTQLEQALITLKMQKNSQARGWVDNQIKAEQKAAQDAQDRADAERRHQDSLRASYARSASAKQMSPQQAQGDFLKYIGDQFKRAGGAGNVGSGNGQITRQMQDKWASDWMKAMGVSGAENQQFYWDAFNSAYNRNNNPYADWTYQKAPKYATATMANKPTY